MTKQFVLTGSYNEFLNYLKLNKLNKKEYVYLNDIFQLKGVQNFIVLYFGCYWENPISRDPEYIRIVKRNATLEYVG